MKNAKKNAKEVRMETVQQIGEALDYAFSSLIVVAEPPVCGVD
jgi:hypothetical protein